jgi:hypothetical protein
MLSTTLTSVESQERIGTVRERERYRKRETGGGSKDRGGVERERERSFLDNQEVTEGKHNALSGNTASERTGPAYDGELYTEKGVYYAYTVQPYDQSLSNTHTQTDSP